MTRMTSESMIDYEALAQDAMRNVVRSVLMDAADKGLPGEHHFYISFDTLAPGVILSKRLREKYAEEMTIVLQHRFWDLIVSDTRFEVKLTFDGIPERLVVPFKSIRVFFDPSVRYGLQFETATSANEDTAGEVDALDDDEPFDDPFADRELSSRGRPPGAVEQDHAGAVPRISPVKQRLGALQSQSPGQSGDEPGRQDEAELSDASDEQPDGEEAEEAAKVVSLDAFRKK